jgi:hypothetical protein
MEPKPKGAIPTVLSVKDKAGNEYVCPQSALRNPEKVEDEEKTYCEPKQPTKTGPQATSTQ